MPRTDMPRSVTFLYQGVRPGNELFALLGEERRVNVISSPVELAKGPPPDVVVVDVAAPDRRAVCEKVRRHYPGPLLLLLGHGESGHDLPPDRNRTLLARPFSPRQLSIALARSGPPLPTWGPAGHLQLAPFSVAGSGGADPGPGTASSVVAHAGSRRPRSWRERRLVRVSVISVMAALLFMGAFAVVSQGDRCGPGCTNLVGADLAAPSSTAVSVGQAGPAPTDPGAGRVDPTTNDPSAGPTANGESQGDGAGSGGTPSSATTASSSGAPTPTPDPTSAPAPTRPQPTTAPTTTRPKTSTSTSTSTTATTATTTTTTSTRP